MITTSAIANTGRKWRSSAMKNAKIGEQTIFRKTIVKISWECAESALNSMLIPTAKSAVAKVALDKYVKDDATHGGNGI